MAKPQKSDKSQKIVTKDRMCLLKKRLVDIAHLSSTLALLHWDQDVFMPPKGVDARAKTISHLTGIIHNDLIKIDDDGLLSDLKEIAVTSSTATSTAILTPKEKTIVVETARSFDREKKLTEDFVKRLSETTSRANSVWIQAREENNFKLFLPWLEKIIDLKREEARLVGFERSSYDALIDTYEPGMTAAKASIILNDLKSFLVPFIKQTLAKQTNKKTVLKKILQGNFPVDKQIEFTKILADKIGFDSGAGRIDVSAHPFTTNFNPADVRFTTHYNPHRIMDSIGSTIHEAGHGMYEQGLPAEHFGTPLAESISLGIHESQSRFWENIIGKSKEFWKYFYPLLVEKFPKQLNSIPLDDFYQAINAVKPSFIRIESDEATYNLHIIIRFEIEKELIEGSIEASDVPKIWRNKVKEYLGIDVPDDSHGVLQDVHWSAGLIGYFPTYTFGNLYSAQFFAAMKHDMPDMMDKVAKGEFEAILSWLRKNIHVHGKLYTADSLVMAVTGEPLNSKYFIEYLKGKYSN